MPNTETKQHTSLPWEIRGAGVIARRQWVIAEVAKLPNELETLANQEFIVAACNAHQALYEALSALLPRVEADFQDKAELAFVCGEVLLPWMDLIAARAALALADAAKEGQ